MVPESAGTVMACLAADDEYDDRTGERGWSDATVVRWSAQLLVRWIGAVPASFLAETLEL